MQSSYGDQIRALVIGGGGREHAIAWSLSRSTKVDKVICTTGNGGTAHESQKIINCNPTIKISDFEGLLEVARTHKVNLVVPCSDESLVLGVVDFFETRHFRVFGPTKKSAIIEGSKVWAKSFMKRHNIPTPHYQSFSSLSKATSYLQSQPEGKHVVKASGLAAGKGVFLCDSKGEAEDAARKLMIERVFGDSGKEIVIEEYVVGCELSVTLITDGNTWKVFPFGQDAQRIYDGNVGPNTGGMGVCIPLNYFSDKEIQEIEEMILEPTMRGLQSDGFICFGVMQTADGPKLLEYNARFGDPEAQALFPLLDDTSDLADIMIACTNGELRNTHMGFQRKAAVSLVLSSSGYPGRYNIGETINIGNLPKDLLVFHSGTLMANKFLVTSGGRVLTIVCIANSTKEAIQGVYNGVLQVGFKAQ